MPTRPPVHKPYPQRERRLPALVVQQKRTSARVRGYTWRWEKARAAFLARRPLCAHCEREHRFTPATVVDHVEPHRGNDELFWDQTNWQPLCKPHHDAKTAREDGGFGNAGGRRVESRK
jgi:5-methylcytosine-specific restriction enzyme A